MTPPLTPLDDDELLVGVAVFVGGLGVRLGFDPVTMVFTAMTVAFWTFKPATPDNICQTREGSRGLCNPLNMQALACHGQRFQLDHCGLKRICMAWASPQ